MANEKVTVMHGFVLHDGKMHGVGDELTLSSKQVERLGDQVQKSSTDEAKQTRKAAEATNADQTANDGTSEDK